jgi:UDP-N-acetylglucosamine--N-acetylmuramyl-(pentapeptide) pyrophosphoryl-undecaprenol N-acetylglucosamine transferase
VSVRILIAGGGTGGHVFPALAFAEACAERWGHDAIEFVGTEHGLESHLVPARGFTLRTLRALPLKGVSFVRKLRSLIVLPAALWQARAFIRAFKPNLIVGVGGYAAGAMVLAGWLHRIPTAIMEQNAIPGFTNRVLTFFARLIFTGLPTRGFPPRKVHLTGNPVRREIIAVRGAPYPADNEFIVLVYGGSQGARAINDLLCAAAPKLRAIPGLHIVHQTGRGETERVSRAYAEAGVAAEIYEFIEQMEVHYQRSHLVVSRAGAMTIAELAVVGRPAILIPFPFATDDHQRHNAHVLEKAGGALVRDQKTFSAADLAALLTELAADRARCRAMAAAAKSVGRPDAAQRMVELIDIKVLGNDSAPLATEENGVS